MQTEVGEGQYGTPKLVVTADDDAAFTIVRVDFNGREKEVGCDLPGFATNPETSGSIGASEAAQGTPFPTTLKRGDTADFYSVCGKILTADIYTNRGGKHFKFNPNE
jgi:hypothetical protein